MTTEQINPNMEKTKKHFVFIKEKEGEVKLECATYEEAIRVKKSFENYYNGRAHSIEIVMGH